MRRVSMHIQIKETGNKRIIIFITQGTTENRPRFGHEAYKNLS